MVSDMLVAGTSESIRMPAARALAHAAKALKVDPERLLTPPIVLLTERPRSKTRAQGGLGSGRGARPSTTRLAHSNVTEGVWAL